MPHSKVFSLVLAALTITMIAFGLRVTAIDQTPPTPYWEEVALGYDAWSILKTGKDHHGHTWPVVAFTSFGDYKPSLYFYTVVPSVATFGMNTFAVRFPAALFSALTVGLSAVLAYQLSRLQRVMWLAGLLLAIQPWHWWLGRVGFEVNLATFLMTAGIVTLIAQLRAQTSQARWGWLLLSVVCWSLSMYAYHGARLLAPLLALWTWLALVNWTEVKRSTVTTLAPYAVATCLALALIAPILLAAGSPVVQQRIQETSIFNDPQPVLTANQAREAAGNTVLSRALFHRWRYRSEDILTRWTSHFSPAFLFISGDENPRHSSQYFGMLYPWELFTIAIGILVLSPKNRWRLGGLTLLAPIAASMTTGTPHALRAMILSVFLAIWSAYGVDAVWKWWIDLEIPYITRQLKNGFFLFVLSGVVLMSTTIAWNYWWNIYPHRYSSEWQYGYQEVVEYLNTHRTIGEPVFMSRQFGRPAMYVWFMTQTDPSIVQAAAATAPKDQGEFLRFQEWQFVDTWPATGTPGWYAGEEGTLPADTPIIHTVVDINGEPLWQIARRTSEMTQ